MSNSVEKFKKKSTIPIYMIGGLWILYGLIFPLYKPANIIICIVLSFVVYFVGNLIFPAKIIEIPIEKIDEKEKTSYNPNTGNPETDQMIRDGFSKISQLKEIGKKINNPVMATKVNRIISLSESIFDAVTTKPQKAQSIRKFMNYYLPTTIKLLQTYVQLSESGVQGENVFSTMRSIEKSMDMIVEAFEKQLDNLYFDVAMDISTDIDVLETILENENLKETDI